MPIDRGQIEAALSRLPAEQHPAFLAEVKQRLSAEREGVTTPATPATPGPQDPWYSRLAEGAIKQVPLTAMDATGVMTRPVSAVADILAEKLGFGEAAQKARDVRETARYHAQAPYQPTEDEGTAGTIGRFTTKAAPQAALAAVTGGASIPVQAAVQGTGQAAQTAAEGGTAGEIAGSGALGAAFGTAGPAVAGAAKAVAPRVINSLIKPLAKAFRFGKDPGRGIVSEGIVARSASQLKEKLSEKLVSIGGEIESLLTRRSVAAKAIDITPALAEVDRAIVEGAKSGEPLLLTRLKALKQALTQELDAATGEFGTLKPTSLTPRAAHQLKVELGKASKWTGQTFDGEVNQARVAVYRALNDMIDKAAPGAKRLQARYADMLTAKSSLERTMEIQARQNILSFPNLVVGGGGFAAGGLPGVAAVAGARAIAGSTPGKTLAAQFLRRFPNTSPALQALLRAGVSGGEE